MSLSKGMVKNLRDGTEVPYEIEVLNSADLDAILKLQNYIVEDNHGMETYMPMSREEIYEDLTEGGLVVGLKISDSLMGYFMIHYIHGEDKDICQGVDIPVLKQNEGLLGRFRHVGIHPDYRGSSLAKLMSRFVMSRAEEKGYDIRYMCTAVAPSNYPSLSHQFTNRMLAVSFKKYHGDYDRLIMFQDFRHPIEISQGEIIDIPGSDVEAIQRILKEGYTGFDLKRTAGETRILFGKPNQSLFSQQRSNAR